MPYHARRKDGKVGVWFKEMGHKPSKLWPKDTGNPKKMALGSLGERPDSDGGDEGGSASPIHF